MADFDFPDNPSDGDVVGKGTSIYEYNASRNKWSIKSAGEFSFFQAGTFNGPRTGTVTKVMEVGGSFAGLTVRTFGGVESDMTGTIKINGSNAETFTITTNDTIIKKFANSIFSANDSITLDINSGRATNLLVKISYV